MNRRILIAVALCGACNSTVLSSAAAVVVPAPPLLDLGVVLVGEEVTGHVTLGVKNGPASLLDVNLLPTEGDGFVFEAETPYVIDVDDNDGFDLTFRPTEAGYASAVVQITTDARDPLVEIEVRSRAVAADLLASPAILDLGVVPTGTTGTGLVKLEDLGDISVPMSGASSTTPGLGVSTAFPLTVLAHGSVDLEVAYTAPNQAPMLGRVSLLVGGVPVSDVVIVRANSCEQGLPSAYDVDGDGVTSCGGDCDDGDAAKGPAGVEVINGDDDDCDGRVDNGTTVYDDDGDGFCEGPTCLGSARPGDCQDADPAVSPGATEVLDNGVDDNCDGILDPNAIDRDGDGFGPSGGDCDDTNALVHPGVVEVLNSKDDDCDGVVDDHTSVFDDDGDGFCESPSSCLGGARTGDCSDVDEDRFPGATETPNFVDDDCDGEVDEGTTRGDDDGDGYTEVGGDCDDADPLRNPARGNCP